MQRITELKLNGAVHWENGKKIIRSPEFRALETADQMIQQAQTAARQILDESNKSADQARRAGHEEGIQQGLATQARCISEAVLRVDEYFRSIEEQVVALVLASVKKVLGEIDERVLITRIVSNALAVMQRQNRLTVRVNPSLTEHVRNAVGEILSSYPLVRILDVIGDDSLSGTQCIIEGKTGKVTADINRQLSALEASVMAVSKHRSITVSEELLSLQNTAIDNLYRTSGQSSGAPNA